MVNANENHFMLISLLFELPLSGGVVTSTSYDILNVVRYMNAQDQGTVVCAPSLRTRFFKVFRLGILCVVMIVGHLQSGVQQLLRAGLQGYLNSIYNWLDLTILLVRGNSFFPHVFRFLRSSWLCDFTK